jgi:hypothetical protein
VDVDDWYLAGCCLGPSPDAPFSVTAVLTLALGIAANVIVFGVLQSMILRSVDVPHGDRVMTLELSTSAFPFIAYPEVRDVRDDNTVFSAVAADSMQNFGLEADGVTRPVWGYEVSGQYFEVAAIQPFLGRLLQRADDDHPGASAAAVLSWPAWRSYFGGDPNIPSVAFTMVLTGSLSVAGPVRRALHIDPANLLREQ